LVGGACTGNAVDHGEPKLLLIGLDGVRVDRLQAAATPNLDALAAAGFFSSALGTADPTVSGPCWSSMLTGVWPEKHGVRGNDFTANRYEEYPDFLTRLERADGTLSTYAVVDWPPLGSSASGGPLLSGAIDRIALIDGDSLGYRVADSLSIEAAIDALADPDLDAAFVYLGDVDVVGHEYGAVGSEYRAAIEWADTRVGMLVEAIRRRSTLSGEDWLVLVSSDHGRTDAGTHGGESAIERTVFLIVSGGGADAAASGEARIVDVAATALAHFGVPIDPAWALDGGRSGLRTAGERSSGGVPDVLRIPGPAARRDRSGPGEPHR
jgi:predicted AlkP superfamily pyrophosphatase or phosphodiesterase